MFRWIYQMGAAHENERIRRLIAEFSADSQQEIGWLENLDKKAQRAENQKRLSELHAAKGILNRLLEPQFIGERDYGPAPIDNKTASSK